MNATQPTITSGGAPGIDPAPVIRPVRPSYLLLKDLVDRFLAIAALALLAPLLAWIAIRIRRDSRGPVLFSQFRAGLNGRPFRVLKFRTMRLDADPYGDSPQSGEDPRITPLGRWLRETSLDELPQLINVARGEMSLVGPRPLYVQQIVEWNERQRGRLLVKPGMTGLSQIRGRAAIPMEEKLEIDVQYVERISPRLDLWIILATLHAVRTSQDIYETKYSVHRVRRSDR
ncbi:MAG: sugar transferase [Phycisphaerales bacterium]|nr:sugar transferase [Phycisphaerales bacterium]